MKAPPFLKIMLGIILMMFLVGCTLPVASQIDTEFATQVALTVAASQNDPVAAGSASEDDAPPATAQVLSGAFATSTSATSTPVSLFSSADPATDPAPGEASATPQPLAPAAVSPSATPTIETFTLLGNPDNYVQIIKFEGSPSAAVGDGVYLEWEVLNGNCGVFLDGEIVLEEGFTLYIAPGPVGTTVTHELLVRGGDCANAYEAVSYVTVQYLAGVPTPTFTPTPTQVAPTSQTINLPIRSSGSYDFGTNEDWQGPIKFGDDMDNHFLQGYVSFDISQIPAGVTINRADLILGDCQIIGTPLSNFVDVLDATNGLTAQYSCLSPGSIDYTLNVTYAYNADLAYILIWLEVQNTSADKADNRDDSIYFQNPVLTVTYTVP